MNTELRKKLIEAANKVPLRPYIFIRGQVGRVKSGVIQDGQTPKYWGGAKVIIISRKRTPLFKSHIYTVKHLENNRTCEFKEDELDKRFRRKSWKL